MEWGRLAGRLKGGSGGASVEKKRGGRLEDFRGITIMPAVYKIYAAILAERLRKKVEEKGIIPRNQAGFRRGRSNR